MTGKGWKMIRGTKLNPNAKLTVARSHDPCRHKTAGMVELPDGTDVVGCFSCKKTFSEEDYAHMQSGVDW